MNFTKYAAYRQSGVDVIGAIPAHWEARPLRQLGRLLKGIGGSKEDVVAEGVPCVRYGDLYTTHAEVIERARTFLTEDRAAAYTPIKYGDVLFAASGEKIDEIGKSAVNLIQGDARCGGDLIVLRPSVPMIPRFLGYAADASPSVAQKTSMGRGTTVKHIYPDELRNLIVAVPPVAEQQAIADLLDRNTAAIDELITKKRRLVGLLAEKRQVLVTQAVTKGLDPTSALKDSGVEWAGPVPNHWDVLPVKRLALDGARTFTDGDWIETPFITESGIRLIQTGNVGVGSYRDQGFRYISEETFAALRCTEVFPGDVLICRLDGPVGRACLAPNLGVRMITSVDNAVLKPSNGNDPRFIVYVLSLPKYLDWVQGLCRVGGGFRFRISRSMLGDFRVPVPPAQEQRSIADHLDATTRAIEKIEERLEASVERLREYRQALITAAVTGKIDVHQTESQTNRVLDGVAESA